MMEMTSLTQPEALALREQITKSVDDRAMAEGS